MAPSAAAGTTGLERVLLIFLMKNQQNQASANKTFTSKQSIQRSIGQKLSNSQELPRTQPQQHTDRFRRKTFTETFDLSTNLLLLRHNSRFTGQKHERTVKASIYRLKLVQTAKLQLTEQELTRTVKNVKLLIKTSNER